MRDRGIFVTGTDTAVGKTFVAAAIVACLRTSGADVGVMKPFETGCPADGDGLRPTDGIFLRLVAGVDDPLDDVVPCRFSLPLAPMVAADLEGKPVSLAPVMSAFSRLLQRHDILVVEGAGGLLVPIARSRTEVLDAHRQGPREGSHYFMSSLMRDMGLPVVIVARPALGTINHTLLTVRQARREGVRVLGLIINHSKLPARSHAELTNRDALEELSGCPVLATIPFMGAMSVGAVEDAVRSAGPGLTESLLKLLR